MRSHKSRDPFGLTKKVDHIIFPKPYVLSLHAAVYWRAAGGLRERWEMEVPIHEDCLVYIRFVKMVILFSDIVTNQDTTAPKIICALTCLSPI